MIIYKLSDPLKRRLTVHNLQSTKFHLYFHNIFLASGFGAQESASDGAGFIKPADHFNSFLNNQNSPNMYFVTTYTVIFP